MILVRASSRERPTKARASAETSSQPCLSLMEASGAMMLMAATPWRRPISQSLGSCAGVTFRKPVANCAFWSAGSPPYSTGMTT